MNQKIVPHLWFDKEVKEATRLYVETFGEGSKITQESTLHDTPTGDTDVVAFELLGQPFMAINGGPIFKFNPSISFHVKFKSKNEVDRAWEKLAKGGKVLMEIGSYPFSERYGWLEDKYGVSWQLIYTGEQDSDSRIVPVLMFVGDAAGRCEEAINFYTSVFKNAKADVMSRYGTGEEPEKEGSVRYAQVILEGQEFGAMDSAREHKFAFNEAISLMVNCQNQDEIDYYWEKLSADPVHEQCGWLKDKFGVSWQIIPSDLEEKLAKGTPEQVKRLTEAFLKMKKFDLATLERAYEGK